jgi:hypothetical protein
MLVLPTLVLSFCGRAPLNSRAQASGAASSLLASASRSQTPPAFHLEDREDSSSSVYSSRPSAPTTELAIGMVLPVLAVVVLLHASPVDAAGTAAVSAPAAMSASQIFEKAAKRALGGGISGALAGVVQVLLLMWLRTTMNYQYRNGGTSREAIAALYEEGGLRRFYRGVSFALVQTPLTRFGDTAANSGMLALLATSDLPMPARTLCVSAVASLWRIGLTPLDTVKTNLQVRGADGMDAVKAKMSTDGGIPTLYQGALANAAASFVGNYPWYLTFNTLDESLPAAPPGDLALKLCRSAILGICAAAASDTISNSIRVLKVNRQASEKTITYQEAARKIIETDGWGGLLGRGLSTRLFTNALQASIFTVVWKLAEEQVAKGGIV